MCKNSVKPSPEFLNSLTFIKKFCPLPALRGVLGDIAHSFCRARGVLPFVMEPSPEFLSSPQLTKKFNPLPWRGDDLFAVKNLFPHSPISLFPKNVTTLSTHPPIHLHSILKTKSSKQWVIKIQHTQIWTSIVILQVQTRLTALPVLKKQKKMLITLKHSFVNSNKTGIC